MDSIILLFLFLAGLLFSFLSLEAEERMYTVILLLIGTVFFGLILLYSEAYIIGLFYLLVYSGLLSVLFASVSNFIENSDSNLANQSGSEQIQQREDE